MKLLGIDAENFQAQKTSISKRLHEVP